MVRMDRVTGRSDDMLIIRGVNVFPSQIEDVLINIEGTAPHYQLHVRREGIAGRTGTVGGGDRSGAAKTKSARWKRSPGASPRNSSPY